jgi:hypothetical protein
MLDESNINIQTIASSRHVGPIKSRVDDWVKQLDLFGKTLVSVALIHFRIIRLTVACSLFQASEAANLS